MLNRIPGMMALIALAAAMSATADGQDPPEAKAEVSREAMEIHQSGMLFDGHNDLPWAVRSRGGFDQVDISQPTELHTDIDRLRQGGLKAQFWSVYVPASTQVYGSSLIQTLEQIELVHEMCRRYPDVFEMVERAEDVERIVAEGKIASLIGVEGGHSIQNSLQALRELYQRGARYMTLTHSKTLAWADSATDDPKNNGLSPFGKEVVREMNRLGMLVDLSHVSEKCMIDALEVTQAPVIYSHSSARQICDHPRNVSDKLLKLTAENGGVVMVNFMSGYVVPTAELEKNQRARGDCNTVCDHIEHIARVAGIDHVGIGSDYDGVRRLPVGLEDVSTYPKITQELLNRGFTKQQVHKILGGNVLRVLKRAEEVAARLKSERGNGQAGKTLFNVAIESGDFDRESEIVQVLVDAQGFEGSLVTLSDPQGNQYLGQLSQPSIKWGNRSKGKRELSFVLGELAKGTTLRLEARSTGLNQHKGFSWHDDAYGTAELRHDDRHGDKPVMAYMYSPVDDSTEELRQETYKVFHHVYSPDGKMRLTKGPGGLFPHHRGLFYGFNRISYGDGQSADVWHCSKGESQTHEKSVYQVAGPVFGRHLVVIDWRGQDGKPFARELREMTAYKFNNVPVIEFNSILESIAGQVRLDGDPQHAGFQFRATQSVPDNTRKLTFYVRPDGKGEPGKFRNWSAKPNESDVNRQHINLAWHALCMSVQDGDEVVPFTISYLDHPSNPKPARFSERDYGRFGSYFEYELAPEKPLQLSYRIVISNGHLEMEDIQSQSRSFVDPVVESSE